MHFTYEWSGKNQFVGLFSAVNESTWEHLKLIFFPMLALTLWDTFHKNGQEEKFLPARTIGILAAMAFTVIAFYTFIGTTGIIIDFVNILIYFLAVAFGFWIEKHIYSKEFFLNNSLSIVILSLITFLFIIFTYASPEAGIFSAPKM